MQSSIFTKIINGELPCHKVYESTHSFAFMDINPIQPGQVVVVSKRQLSNFYELEGPEYIDFMESIKKVAQQLKRTFPSKKRIGVMIEGLEVDHVHAKVFPIDTGDQFRSFPNASAEPDHAALAAMAEKLAF